MSDKNTIEFYRIADIEFAARCENIKSPCFSYNFYFFESPEVAQPVFEIYFSRTYTPIVCETLLGYYYLPGGVNCTECRVNENGAFQLLQKSRDDGILRMALDYPQNSESDLCFHSYFDYVNGFRGRQLSNAVFGAFTFSALKNGAFIMHASCVTYKGKAYLFLGKSGRGKSTHSRMWVEALGAELINDDKPVVRIFDDEIRAYGSPWSGKTPCFKNESAPLGSIVFINRGVDNRIERATPFRAMSIITPCILGVMRWDIGSMRTLSELMKRLVEKVPVYDLWCTPTHEAAQVCMKAVTKTKND